MFFLFFVFGLLHRVNGWSTTVSVTQSSTPAKWVAQAMRFEYTFLSRLV